MAANLEDRANAELATCQQRLAEAQLALAAAHDELDRRVADPAAVPPAERRSRLGAAQHLAQATLDDADARAGEGELRAKLAGVPSPDAADPVVVDLRKNLIVQAGARVELRAATERAGVARAEIARTAGALAAADTACRAAGSTVTAATARQQRLTDLKAALAAAPLTGVPADAAALRAGPVHAAAADRVAALLPAALLSRSTERHAEAAQPYTEAQARVTHAEAKAAAQASGSGGPEAALVVAAVTLEAAEARARAYAGTAPDRLARASALLTALATLPDLDSATAASIDQAARADAVTAAGQEKDLAEAYAAWAVLDRAVNDARLDALADDPDRDPAGVQAVIDAIAARDDPAVTDPLDDARTAYDAAAQGALDDWEAEVPPWLWAAVHDLHDATAALDDLSDAAAAAALVTELDAAIDGYAAAADTAASRRRAVAVVSQEAARRSAVAGVLAGTGGLRTAQYVRGDARGGRHDRES
ncbi:hypothetical protein AB0L70_35860 [Kribbella sp. NPDC051952]|uniref:hypothetical protein n=1 Tax=Kribbella sp. NPDC051952 TaxID=3154851 RepID=UPI00342B61CA